MSEPLSLLMMAAFASLAGSALCASAAEATKPDAKSIARGKYLVKIAGCNDS